MEPTTLLPVDVCIADMSCDGSSLPGTLLWEVEASIFNSVLSCGPSFQICHPGTGFHFDRCLNSRIQVSPIFCPKMVTMSEYVYP